MHTEIVRDGVERLQQLVRALVKAGVTDREEYRAWKKSHEKTMERIFRYEQKKGMPPMTALVDASFHKTLPILLFNYSRVAHMTLYAFPTGWTPVLRLCRGIVFDREGKLLALPFPKFFNVGENPETTFLPDEPFVATDKKDGHLGIIFEYEGQRHLCTRVTFDGPSATLGNEMLAAEVARTPGWGTLPPDFCPLVEIIHPKTRVHLDYGFTGFVIIGTTDRRSFEDHDHPRLKAVGRLLDLPVTETWEGTSIAELRKLIADPKVRDREGFVVRFKSGLRAKFKFKGYINMMVEEKLSYTYLMNRILAGNLDDMIGELPRPAYRKAQGMVSRIMKAAAIGDEDERKQYLYTLLPKDKSTQYFRGVCRKVLKHLDASA